MDSTKLSELKAFIDQCTLPFSLHLRLGANEEHKDTEARSFVVEEESDGDMEETEEPKPKVEEAIVEFDIELEGDTVEPDNDLPQKDASVEVTDENCEAAQEALIRDNRKTDAAAEIIFSGKARPGLTETNVNVDEVNQKDRHEMSDEQFVNQVKMLVDEGSKEFGFSAKNEVINGKARVIGFLLLLDFELLTGRGLSKGTTFLDFLCSASDAFK
ncbi:unnamed protein product [Thlaspi arvense]|uniref:Uncharacterized protein n=1 Tax=Thlaspi arvense TaxID=13288 RepID=A0AAU9RVG1_THLAR|nr:unnamed protein product [Thlaspi arvense]